MKNISFYVMLAGSSAARVFYSVCVTLRSALLLAGCPAAQVRG
jgi:hypothetical protein